MVREPRARLEFECQLRSMNSYQIHLVLFKAYWLRYRLHFGIATMAVLIWFNALLTCGRVWVSIFTCEPAPLGYLVSMKILSILIIGSMMYFSSKTKFYMLTGRKFPYIISVFVAPMIAPALGKNYFTIPMFVMPIIFGLCIYGVKQIARQLTHA